jgi:hypothetical protein
MEDDQDMPPRQCGVVAESGGVIQGLTDIASEGDSVASRTTDRYETLVTDKAQPAPVVGFIGIIHGRTSCLP